MREGKKITGHYAVNLAKKCGWYDPRLLELLDEKVDPGQVTDDLIIRRFVDLFGTEFRYDHSCGCWYHFDGATWHEQKTQLPKSRIRDICMEFVRVDPKLKWLGQEKAWSQILRGAQSDQDLAVTAESWGQDDFLLGTPRGTIDLKSGELRPAQPSDHIANTTVVSPIPLDSFDEKIDCPIWVRFLDEVLQGDQEAIRFFQQWAGYCLTGSTQEQQFLFVYGPGGSGKSTAINTLADVLNSYAVNVETATLTTQKHARHTTELARLKGRRLARASETEQGQAWSESRIKSLTGEDVVTARFMRQDDFEFRPKFKLTIVGNYRPKLQNVDEAIKRRMIVLPFEFVPAQKDDKLLEKLKTEWPGILSWMINGCLDWQANGLIMPNVAIEATETYFGTQDIFGLWLGECCETSGNYASTGEDLWKSWHRFALNEGADPGTRNSSFPERLRRSGLTPIKNTNGIRGRGYLGVKLLPEREDDLISI